MGHRKLAQSLHLATAFSLALQLVHTNCMSPMSVMSSMSDKICSVGRPLAPLEGMIVSCLHWVHIILGHDGVTKTAESFPSSSSSSLSSSICFSRHASQKTCRHVRTLGFFNFSSQIGHFCSSFSSEDEVRSGEEMGDTFGEPSSEAITYTRSWKQSRSDDKDTYFFSFMLGSWTGRTSTILRTKNEHCQHGQSTKTDTKTNNFIKDQANPGNLMWFLHNYSSYWVIWI